MIEIRAGGIPLDLQEDTQIALSYEIKDGDKVASAKGVGSYTIKLPTSANNLRAFGNLPNLDVDLTRTPVNTERFRLSADIYSEGALELQGFLQVLDWEDDLIRVQFLSGNVAWADALDRPLGDVDRDRTGIDFERWLFTWNFCTWERTIQHTGAIDLEALAVAGSELERLDAFQTHCWPVVAYNQHDAVESVNPAGANPTVDEGLDLQRQRPAAFVWPFLYAHFQQAGYTLKSEFLERVHAGTDERINPLILPHTKNKPFITDYEDGEVLLGRAEQTADHLQPGGKFADVANLDTLVSNPSGEFQLESNSSGANGVPDFTDVWAWVPTRPGRYRIKGRFIIEEADGSGNIEINTNLFGTTQIADGIDLGPLAVSGTPLPTGGAIFWDASFDFVVDLLPEDYYSPNIGYRRLVLFAAIFGNTATSKAGSFLEVYRFNDTIQGDLVDIRDCVPEITALDLFSELIRMFNLSVYVDERTKTVFAEPFTEFFKDTEPVPLDRIIDYSQPIKQQPVSQKKQGLFYNWEEDSDDILLPEYEHPQQLDTSEELTLGDRVIPSDFAADLRNVDIKNFSASVAAPLFISGFDSASQPLYILELRKDTFPQTSFNFYPRICQKAVAGISGSFWVNHLFEDARCSGPDKNVQTENRYLSKVPGPLQYAVAYFGSEQFGFAQQATGSTAPKNGTLNFYSEDGTDLYTRYHRDEYLQEVSGLRIVEVVAMLNRGVTIEQLTTFNGLFVWQDHLFRMLKVDKHQLGKSPLVELTLKLIA